MTPGGMPDSSASRASSIADPDVISDGFKTMVLPAASAGASDMIAMNVGEFHGGMTPTAPSGSRTLEFRILRRSIGMTVPSILSARPPEQISQASPMRAFRPHFG